jgi:dTDP-4-dehydrorhamnose reductase
MEGEQTGRPLRVLVTGSAGQVGRALLGTAPAGVEAWGMSRADLDICSSRSIAAALAERRPDVIINAAAFTAVDRAEIERDAAHAVNAEAPAKLARAAQGMGIRMVHLSTDFVFDGAARRPYRPDAAVRPLSVYGASKAAGEAAVRAILPDALIVRTAWVYAAGGRNFVHTMLRAMASGRQVRVVADQVGTPTHADSLARGLWALVEDRASGTVHLTDGGVASWYDFAVAIAEAAAGQGLIARTAEVTPITTAEYPTAARRPRYSVLDSSDSWRRMGRAPPPWPSELRAMLAQLGEARP